MKTLRNICLALVGAVAWPAVAQAEELEADLLVVGGTESGCAAAVQAARMGVKRIVLVNDIDWLGGQFSAEGLGAIDENRAHGYNGKVPIPRSGIFREAIDAIEARIIAGEGQGVVADLHRVRADLLQLRRAIWPLREAMTTLVRDASLFFSDGLSRALPSSAPTLSSTMEERR